MNYNRLIIKLSGEVLRNNDNAIDKEVIYKICIEIKKLFENNKKVAIVVGGGNFWRGRSHKYLDHITTNNIGMLATVMNALALESVFKEIGCPCVAVSAIEINKMIDFANMKKIKEEYENKIIIFAGGIGNPNFSTDTALSLRAVELESDVMIKLSKVDGIYTSDPETNKDAKRYKEISYDEVINNKLNVMDIESVIMAKNNNIPIIINKLENVNLNNLLTNNSGSIIK